MEILILKVILYIYISKMKLSLMDLTAGYTLCYKRSLDVCTGQ